MQNVQRKCIKIQCLLRAVLVVQSEICSLYFLFAYFSKKNKNSLQQFLIVSLLTLLILICFKNQHPLNISCYHLHPYLCKYQLHGQVKNLCQINQQIIILPSEGTDCLNMNLVQKTRLFFTGPQTPSLGHIFGLISTDKLMIGIVSCYQFMRTMNVYVFSESKVCQKCYLL